MTADLRDEIAAARYLVMELTRRAIVNAGIDSPTRTHLGTASQCLLQAEDAETGRLQRDALNAASAMRPRTFADPVKRGEEL